MTYFDDLQFIDAAVDPVCMAQMNRAFPGTWSLEFLLSGRMHYAVDGGPRTVVDSPTLFWHRPEHSYQYGAADADGWYHHWILMKGPRAKHLIEQGFDQVGEYGKIGVHQTNTFADMFRILVSIIRTGSPRNHHNAVLLLERIYCLLLDEARQQGPSDFRPKIEAVLRKVETAPFETYDFAAIAKQAGLSYSHFRALFSRQIGHAPHEYVLLCRMRQAARKLEQPNAQVKDVAYECGFNDPSQFSRLFKARIGLSPKHYQLAIPQSFSHDW